VDATVLLYSSCIDPFLENLTKIAEPRLLLGEGQRYSPKLTPKMWNKNEDQRIQEAFL
jgi:hypothetical protein